MDGSVKITMADYIKAAKILARCPKDRFEMVIDVLSQSGIDMTAVKEFAGQMTACRRDSLKEQRAMATKEKWKDTDNEIALLLRNKYEAGLSLSEIGRRTGLDKATVYRYLWGERNPSRYSAEAIKKAVAEMEAEA